MIAAMHAENQLYLTRSVLAFALGCDEDRLDRVLRILRREAMLDSGETYILTRHRRIAEAACETLEDDGYDFKRWYPYLAKSAHREFVDRYSGNPDIAKWEFEFANHFIGKGARSWPVARNVAKALCETQEDDPIRLTFYSKVLRETDVPGEAMVLLKVKGERFRSRREVLYEWSVVAGKIGDPGLAAWLGGRSLADGDSPPNPKQCKLSLAGLGRTFELLYESTGRAVFIESQAACGRLGLELPDLDATALEYFGRHASVEADENRAQPTGEENVQTLKNAVTVAADEAEPDNNPPFFENLLGDPNGYRYADLLRVIGGDAPARTARQH